MMNHVNIHPYEGILTLPIQNKDDDEFGQTYHTEDNAQSRQHIPQAPSWLGGFHWQRHEKTTIEEERRGEERRGEEEGRLGDETRGEEESTEEEEPEVCVFVCVCSIYIFPDYFKKLTIDINTQNFHQDHQENIKHNSEQPWYLLAASGWGTQPRSRCHQLGLSACSTPLRLLSLAPQNKH